MSIKCRCASDNRYWFDRALCECGHMHYRCENCGDPLDICYSAEKKAMQAKPGKKNMVPAPMSPNDTISEDVQTHWHGCDTVHPDCHHPAERILRDLIAELRGLSTDSDDEWSRVVAGDMADRAESRLREVTGDE